MEEASHDSADDVKESTEKIFVNHGEEKVLEIFPPFDKVPETIAEKFKAMISSYLLAKSSKSHQLTRMGQYLRVRKVCDDRGKTVCLFKESEFAKIEAAVYLLDHPISSRRSESSELFGFGGAPPTVFLRTDKTSGCLVWFMENDGVVGKYNPLTFTTVTPEIHKVCIFHIRFGNADCNGGNSLTRIDRGGTHRITPIDHEESFTPKYILRRAWWSDYEKHTKQPFSDDFVRYVHQLDAEEDIDFLRTCGWDVPLDVAIPLRVFTFFLKKGVELQLTAHDLVFFAITNPRAGAHNQLDGLVLNGNVNMETDEARFVENATRKISTRLTQYAMQKKCNRRP